MSEKISFQLSLEHVQRERILSRRLVACHSGRTSVLHRRTVPVLRSACSWRVTSYVGKPSAAGQPTRPTQPFIHSKSINWVVSWYRMCAQVAPSGECMAGCGWNDA